MSDKPKLPEAANDNRRFGRAGFHEHIGPSYTAEQMLAFRAEGVAEERERWLDRVHDLAHNVPMSRTQQHATKHD